AFDMNDDGLLDLVVSIREDITLYPNQGTVSAPKWKTDDPPFRLRWGVASLRGMPTVDYDRDGRFDLSSGYEIHLNSGQENPYDFDRVVSLLPRGVRIDHSSGIGDDWFWTRVYDFDRDGRADILCGDWWGRVWNHRNLDASRHEFDIAGETFRL